MRFEVGDLVRSAYYKRLGHGYMNTPIMLVIKVVRCRSSDIVVCSNTNKLGSLDSIFDCTHHTVRYDSNTLDLVERFYDNKPRDEEMIAFKVALKLRGLI